MTDNKGDRRVSRSGNAIVCSLTDHVIPRLRERHGVSTGSPNAKAETDAAFAPPAEASHRDRAERAEAPAFTREDVAAFAAALMAVGDGGWRASFRKHLREGAGRAQLRDGLLAPTASLLGDLWCSDDATMVDVTVATSRLQVALEELPGEPRDGSGARMLLTRAPGDTHVFGLFMLADTLREANWSVRVELRSDASVLERSLATRGFDVVGIGVAATRYVPAAAKLAEALLGGSCGQRGIPLLAGGPGTVGGADALRRAGFAAVIAPGPDVAAAVSSAMATIPQRNGNVMPFARA